VFDKLHDGDIIEVSEPRNHFELEAAPRYVFVAGGIGITPILPMIAAAEAAGAEWTLLYGGRTRTSIAFRDELQRYGDRVVIAPQDEVGVLDLTGQLMAPRPSTLVYGCGPEPMLDALDTAMTAWPAGSLHVERFTPRTIETDGADEAFEVAFAASGVTLVVPPDRSILDVAQDRGLPVDFSCGEGTCGTCEAPLLAGRAEHRDALLTDEEKDAQDTVFLCVSRAERGCARLEIDL
jgi:ferredoxin-NADP reductase